MISGYCWAGKFQSNKREQKTLVTPQDKCCRLSMFIIWGGCACVWVSIYLWGHGGCGIGTGTLGWAFLKGLASFVSFLGTFSGKLLRQGYNLWEGTIFRFIGKMRKRWQMDLFYYVTKHLHVLMYSFSLSSDCDMESFKSLHWKLGIQP